MKIYTFDFYVSYRSKFLNEDGRFKEHNRFKVLASNRKQAMAILKGTIQFQSLEQRYRTSDEDKQSIALGLKSPVISNVPTLIHSDHCLVYRYLPEEQIVKLERQNGDNLPGADL